MARPRRVGIDAGKDQGADGLVWGAGGGGHEAAGVPFSSAHWGWFLRLLPELSQTLLTFCPIPWSASWSLLAGAGAQPFLGVMSSALAVVMVMGGLARRKPPLYKLNLGRTMVIPKGGVIPRESLGWSPSCF
jgi:hypothetical protein